MWEALGDWEDECAWFMKADADAYVDIPAIRERLECFDHEQEWLLGSPQTAEKKGRSKSVTFASGGAGYFISRGLIQKTASYMPVCLLELLQTNGGTGMEDVAFSSCFAVR